MAKLTPMMQQYLSTKEQYPDALLFFRLGDFYEMFFEDAKTASKELELTLTGRDCGLAERAPMCGVPHHSAQTYIARLIEKGYKVAICEQMQDPSEAKGLVERDVIRVITPGTVIEPDMLEDKRNNYILCVFAAKKKAGLAYADVSTGEFFAYQIEDAEERLPDEVSRIAPREMLINEAVAQEWASSETAAQPFQDIAFSPQKARKKLLDHFSVQNLEPYGIEELPLAVRAAGALMQYLENTQRNALSHITMLRRYQPERSLLLDKTARRNLELTENLRGQDKRHTLFGLLDFTATAMGGRMLRSFIEHPLNDLGDIRNRQEAVEALHGDALIHQNLNDALRGVYDMERLTTKLAYQNISPRDCLALQASFGKIPGIKDSLALLPGAQIAFLQSQLDELADLRELLEQSIHPDAPLTQGEGGFIQDGYNEELDGLRRASLDGKQWLLELETKEKEETGIKNLRIQYNRVFGYYLEVTKSNLDKVPYRYHRKQTLANAERYTTPELSELERKVTGAQERALQVETQLFHEVRVQLGRNIARIQRSAAALKTLDALLALATAAQEYDYVRPEMAEDGPLVIRDGRHPVVSHTLGSHAFVPNDTEMDDENRMQIITGPNMAGKSTYMRQVALIVLMAHIGSFVPASSARIPRTDRIFTRIGASDDVAGGQSTFMVEMNEMAYILHHVTPHSLLILDEIGRGTSTFDGLSIAWSVVEYLSDARMQGVKTLFATHYHELSELEGRQPGVANYRVTAQEHGEDVIFLHKVQRGGADKSFGIHVARLAGMPKKVLLRAQEILARLEAADVNQNTIGQNILEENKKTHKAQVSLWSSASTELIEQLRDLDVMNLTPMDAMQKLFELREKARRM